MREWTEAVEPTHRPRAVLQEARPTSDRDVVVLGWHPIDVSPVPAPGVVAPDADSFVLLGAWKSWLEAQFAENTVRHYWQSVMRLLIAYPVDVRYLTPEHVIDFLQQFPPRTSARRSYYQGLHSFFAWGVRRGVFTDDPTETIRVPAVVKKVPRALSEDEYERVIEAAYAHNPRRGAAIKLLYYTAARAGEAVTIRWTDFNEERLVLHGHKTGEDRVIAMTEGLADTLDELRVFFGTHEYVIPRSSATLWQWCREAGKAAGVKDVHPHLFRSTAATRMLKRGALPTAVQHVLGHSKIATTQSYWAVEESDKAAALELL